MLMSGSYFLSLMTNDEPDGGLLVTTDGWLPHHDVDVDGHAVAEADAAAAAAVVSS